MLNWGIFHDLFEKVGEFVFRARNRKIALCVAFVGMIPSVSVANQAPVIESFSASQATIAPGGIVTLTVIASDPDCAEGCSSGCGLYIRSDLTTWSADGGVFLSKDNGVNGSPYTATAQWQAPGTEGVYTLEITLSDSGSFLCGNRQSTTAGLLVTVTTSQNQAPNIDWAVADPTRLFPDETAGLRCSATDPDGDSITYSWETDLGVVTQGRGSSAVFSSSEPGVATVLCRATDSNGAATQRPVILSISDVVAKRAVTTELGSPQRLAIDSRGSLFVADRSRAVISVHRLEDGEFLYRIPIAGITAVAIDWADRLVVGTVGGAMVLRSDGVLIRPLDLGGAEISDIAVDFERRRYVFLQGHAGRVILSDETGLIESSFGETGDAPNQVRGPSGIAVMPDGRIVVADRGHGVLKVFDPDGTLSLTIGSSGAGAGQFVGLDDVSVDSRGVIWVSDAFQDWVQTFGPDGALREIVGTYGDGIGQFRTAAGIALSEKFGLVAVASLNSSSVQIFDLDLTAPVEWPLAEASISPASLTFSAQTVGTTSAALGLDISNTGNGPLGIGGFEVTGPFAVSGGCDVVEPRTGCSFDVVFRPSYPGNHLGELILHTSTSPEPLRVVLEGLGFVPAHLVVDRQNLEFSPQRINSVSDVQIVGVYNSGSVSLSFSGISVDGPFGLNSHCGSSLSGGQSCTLWIDFRPVSPGLISGVVTIQTDSGGGVHRISLSGSAEILELSPQPGNVFFGSVSPGMVGLTEQVEVVNTGTARVTVGELSLGGPNPEAFEVVTDQCSGNLVEEGQSCWLQLRFSPPETGVLSAQLMIPISDGLEFVVNLEGGELSLFADGFESGDTGSWSVRTPAKGLGVIEDGRGFGGEEIGAQR